MKTGPEIINEFVTKNGIDMADFTEWFDDCKCPLEEANHYDTRFLQHLVSYVEERDLRE